MKATDENIKIYKSMEAQVETSIGKQVEIHLQKHCPKFIPKKLSGCLDFIKETVCEMLGGKAKAEKISGASVLAGHISSDTVFKIARDYFNEEIWKSEKQKKTNKEKQKEIVPEKNEEILSENKKEKKVDDKTEQMSLFG